MTEFPVSTALQMDGLNLLAALEPGSVQTVFFDPQYTFDYPDGDYRAKGCLEKSDRNQKRRSLPQMSDEVIADFCHRIFTVLQPQGHLFFWCNMMKLTNATASTQVVDAGFMGVDMLTWDKVKMGMGYRFRKCCEYCLAFQKPPIRARDCWHDNALRDIWRERIKARDHPHRKPVALLERLILATTKENDLVVDPAAGSFATLEACIATKRNFIGCDINRIPDQMPLC